MFDQSSVIFLTDYGALVQRISKLLGTGEKEKVVPSNRNMPIERSLFRILDLHFRGKHDIRDWEMSRWILFANQMETIKRHRPEIFDSYRNRLGSNRLDHYIGTRFEVNIASMLINDEIDFECPDPPDFSIKGLSSPVSIECGSVHLSKPKSRDTKYKIQSVIREKSKKPYCLPSSSIFIDFTSIHNVMVGNQFYGRGLDYYEEIRDSAIRVLRNTDFGSLLLFSYTVDLDRNRYASNYIRVDNYCISADLYSLLDHVFPKGRYDLLDYRIPPVG